MTVQEIIEIVAPVCLFSSIVGTMLGMAIYMAASKFFVALMNLIFSLFRKRFS